jgi:hypothetical protein
VPQAVQPAAESRWRSNSQKLGFFSSRIEATMASVNSVALTVLDRIKERKEE